MIQAFPLNKSSLLLLCQKLRDNKVPVTRSMKFKESLNFFHGTLGPSNMSVATDSPRFQGAVFSCTDAQRPLVQRSPLSLLEVQDLERLVLRAALEELVVFAGYCLLCLHTCAWHSDAQRLPQLAYHASPCEVGPQERMVWGSNVHLRSQCLVNTSFARVGDVWGRHQRSWPAFLARTHTHSLKCTLSELVRQGRSGRVCHCI